MLTDRKTITHKLYSSNVRLSTASAHEMVRQCSGMSVKETDARSIERTAVGAICMACISASDVTIPIRSRQKLWKCSTRYIGLGISGVSTDHRPLIWEPARVERVAGNIWIERLSHYQLAELCYWDTSLGPLSWKMTTYIGLLVYPTKWEWYRDIFELMLFVLSVE